MKKGKTTLTPIARRMVCIAAIALVAGFAIWLAVVLGSRPDSEMERFLMSPSPLNEKLQKSLRDAAAASEIPDTPLVKAAREFALCLNPPAKPKPGAPATGKGIAVASAPQVQPAATSPKFALHGISYHRSKPAESMALVCEPDGGRRWVRQGAQLGHIVIEKIGSSSIVYHEGQESHGGY